MRRRDYLASLCGGMTALIAGCTTVSNPLPTPSECEKNYDPCARLSHTPSKPAVGQSVVFDASGSISPDDQTLFYFWKVGPNTKVSAPEEMAYAAEGPKYTHRFQTKGRHIIEVIVTEGHNVSNSEEAFPNIGYGPEDAAPLARKSEEVNVQELKEDPLSKQTEKVSISLKGSRQSTSIDNPAIISFSLTSIIGNGQLTAQLILEIPTGLVVNGTSFNQGGGQFTSTYQVDPGETKSESIRVRANEPGPYLISGYAVYTFENGPENRETKRAEIQLRFYE